MNKKFMVVALMAALSTVGYAFELTNESVGFSNGSQGSDYQKVDKNFEDVENDLNRVQGVLGNLEVADQDLAAKDTELENKVNDLNDKLFADGTGVLGNLEVADKNLQEQIDGMKTDISNAGLAADAANEGMLENKQDIADLNTKLEGYEDVKENANSAIILGQENSNKIDDLYANKADKSDVTANKDAIADLNTKLEGYEDVKENANSAIILGQENSNKIDDLYANKVDNSKFEEHKKQQEAKDNDQDDKIQANKDAIEKETADRKAEDERLQGQINDFNNKFAGYDGRLSGLEKKVDHLDDKMNKGLSLMAAMNAVDFQNVQTGEMALGAGVGHYGNAQSVALGVAYAPVEDLTVNAKYSITAGDPDSFAVGAGATYKFKVGR